MTQTQYQWTVPCTRSFVNNFVAVKMHATYKQFQPIPYTQVPTRSVYNKKRKEYLEFELQRKKMDMNSEIMEAAMQVVVEQLAECAQFNEYSSMVEMSLLEYVEESWRQQNYYKNKRYRRYKQGGGQTTCKQSIPLHGTGVFIARGGGSQDEKSSSCGTSDKAAETTTLSSENSSDDLSDQMSLLEQTSEYEYPQADVQACMVYQAAEKVLLESIENPQ
eukprot:TRINITY_DN30128_c0_g1_i1.p4 TRINITY_DN30128_c0_g1~~TRINITY_DN30128_c0_g1_i1.p4  ORF type:complete len:219 (-),score=36.39 TRINITY_DN30128_c0_g1_i1:1841-2497(-)